MIKSHTTFAFSWVALALLFACSPISRLAGEFKPKEPGYAYTDGLVTRNGQPIYRVVQSNVDRLTTSYEIQDAEGKSQARVTFASSHGGTIDCRADFASVGVHYEGRMQAVPFSTLLASYIDNGVLKNGQVDSEGLKGYAAARSIRLIDTAAQMKRLDESSKRMACTDCAGQFRLCQVEGAARRRHPPRGVSTVASCETTFQACSQGGILTRADEWPCGPAPH